MRKALIEKFAGLGLEAASTLKANKTVPLVAIRGFADDANLNKTPLYDFHVQHGGERRASPANVPARHDPRTHFSPIDCGVSSVFSLLELDVSMSLLQFLSVEL